MLYINAHINDYEQSAAAIREARRRIKFRCDLAASTMIDVLSGRGWTQVDEDDDSWNLYWNDVNKTAEILDSRQFEPHQKIPHFRNHFELTRKNLLAKNLRHYKRYLKRQECKREVLADIMPRTYEIPSEYAKFLAHFDKSPGITWILKPASGRQGSGIFLFQELKDLDAWREDLVADEVESAKTLTAKKSGQRLARADTIDLPGVYVVQKYVERPYLIEGKKFDIRFYVLVTTWRPLTVWLSRDGFARICGNKYSLENLRANRVHLTNMAIQLRPASRVDSVPGTKWTMQKLKRFLEQQHGAAATGELMERVATLVMTSLRSVAKRIRHDPRCFELYGYDVLLDDKLKPWLLEVNASPSLNATGPEDYRMKFDLLNDVANIIDFEDTFTGFESRIGGFDLIWKDGPVLTLRDAVGTEGDYDNFVGKVAAYSVTDSSHPEHRLNCHLGETNDRIDQLAVLKFQRQVAKVIDNLPSEPFWAPPDLTAAELPLVEALNPVAASTEDEKPVLGNAVTIGDIAGGISAPGRLLWDKATVAKVTEDNFYGARRKGDDRENGEAASSPEENDNAYYTFRKKVAAKKPKGENVAVRKAVGAKEIAMKKATTKEVAGGKVRTKKVLSEKVTTKEVEGASATTKEVASDKVKTKEVASAKVNTNEAYRPKDTTKEDAGDKHTTKEVFGDKVAAKEVANKKIPTNEVARSEKITKRSVHNEKVTRRKVKKVGEAKKTAKRSSAAKAAGGKSETSGAGSSESSDDSGPASSPESRVGSSRESRVESSRESSRANSISCVSRKMFCPSGLGAWSPRLP